MKEARLNKLGLSGSGIFYSISLHNWTWVEYSLAWVFVWLAIKININITFLKITAFLFLDYNLEKASKNWKMYEENTQWSAKPIFIALIDWVIFYKNNL